MQDKGLLLTRPAGSGSVFGVKYLRLIPVIALAGCSLFLSSPAAVDAGVDGGVLDASLSDAQTEAGLADTGIVADAGVRRDVAAPDAMRDALVSVDTGPVGDAADPLDGGPGGDGGLTGDGGLGGDGGPVADSGGVVDAGIPPGRSVSLALGGLHTCVVVNDGTVECCGDNEYGQLGLEDLQDRNGSRAVPNLTQVASLGLGDATSCAVHDNGSVSCWGRNDFGQTGDGTLNHHFAPVVVPDLTGVAQTSVGADHACARINTGVVSCWGRNNFGQLGDGSNTIDSIVPVAVLAPE